MARPQKKGLDYFSVNCKLEHDEELLVSEYGAKSLGLLLYLKIKIFGGEGYYIKWGRDVALVFARDLQLGVNVVGEIVRACIRRGIFHQEMYDRYGILTSEEVQYEYANATERRTFQKIDGRYLLISAPLNWIIDNDNAVSAYNNGVNVDDNTQRREEESREDSIIHSNAREDEEYPEGADLDDPSCRRKYLHGIGKGKVLLSDDQIGDLLHRISIEEFNYYVGVVADNELKGHHYKKKTHYEAILGMAMKDRRVKKGYESKHT